ncbi:MAG: Gldg family protein [Clostridia bacterium]|nr:Gldg family protein [Clostridia bacterium]
MNRSFMHSRKFRYGSVSVALTALFIAAVIIVNVIFTALSTKFMWYIDMTSEELYTVSEATWAALEDVDKDIKIIFCSDPDTLESNEMLRIVYNTALQFEERMPNISVETINIINNPSSVQKYTMAGSTIKTYSVIVESGTEFRVLSVQAFYTYSDTTSETPWAYSGERKFVSTILSVTQAESPIACLTYTHGEKHYDYELLTLINDAGYVIQEIDLTREELPADCRLLVVFNPLTDFQVKDGISDISEIEKIDKFLDNNNAMMVFMNPNTPPLPNFEEYLEEWGVIVNREQVRDTENSVATDGYAIIGTYTDGDTLGASIHKELRTTRVVPPKTIFDNVAHITFADGYDATGYYNSNSVSRQISSVFTSSPTAQAYANGKPVSSATELEPYNLMTITCENQRIDNENFTEAYVVVCPSTEYAKAAMLQSNTYGNADLLYATFRSIGKEKVPADIARKPFAQVEIEGLTTADANTYTVVLTVIPPVVAFGLCLYVIIRRKYA